MTQSQLAEAVDLTVDALSRLERGAATPSLARIERVAKALDVELWQLFRFDSAVAEESDKPAVRIRDIVDGMSPSQVELVADVLERIFAARTPPTKP